MATTTPGQSLPVPTSGDDPDIPGDLLALANAIEKRLMGVYNNAADRDARITSPQEGQFAYLKDTKLVYQYTGSAWTRFPAAQPTVYVGTTAPNNASGVDGDVYYRV